MDASKLFTALLNGLAKRTYFGEKEFDDETLRSQLYPSMSAEDFDVLVRKCEGILQEISHEDMDLQQIMDYVKTVALTEEQGQALVKFWRNQKAKIHDVLVSQSHWTNKLAAVSWRIDVKTKSKNIQDLNEPAAIVELEIKPPTGEKESVFFEMDAQKANEIVAQIEAIQKVISS